jgi:hypothetical protein
VALLSVFQFASFISPTYIQQLRAIVPPPSQNTVAVCNQITLLYHTILLLYCYYMIDAPIKFSGILLLLLVLS